MRAPEAWTCVTWVWCGSNSRRSSQVKWMRMKRCGRGTIEVAGYELGARMDNDVYTIIMRIKQNTDQMRIKQNPRCPRNEWPLLQCALRANGAVPSPLLLTNPPIADVFLLPTNPAPCGQHREVRSWISAEF